MKKINEGLASTDFFNKPNRFWQLSGEKIILVEKDYDETKGPPVFTLEGKYAMCAFTEWTQGFQYRSDIIQFDFTRKKELIGTIKNKTLTKNAPISAI